MRLQTPGLPFGSWVGPFRFSHIDFALVPTEWDGRCIAANCLRVKVAVGSVEFDFTACSGDRRESLVDIYIYIASQKSQPEQGAPQLAFPLGVSCFSFFHLKSIRTPAANAVGRTTKTTRYTKG